MAKKPFKERYSFEQMKSEADRILKKYPDRVPVIVEKKNGSGLPEIDRQKYLIPAHLPFSALSYVIRKRLKLDQTKALFMFVNNTLLSQTMLLSQIYKENKDTCGFLFVIYTEEDTFGKI